MKSRRWLLGGISAALIALILSLGGVQRVASLLVSIDRASLFYATLAALASLGFRAIRLSLLLQPGELGPLKAFPVTSVAQMAAVFIPARLGEFVLPFLLERAGGRDKSSGVAILLASRTLDTAALGAWALAALLLRRGGKTPAILFAGFLLFLPLLFLPFLLSRADRWTARREAGWNESLGVWAGRLHRIREGLEQALRHPSRLALAALACLGSWACQWLLTWNLLIGMGNRWPIWDVVTGAAAASLSNLLPLSLIANLGTLEAGWTLAFSAMGIPTNIAAATGLATHLWALILVALIGALCWPLLPRRGGKNT